MPCDRLSLLKRLAVDSPSQLQTPPWQEHMEGCGECRMEKQVLDGTLAVFTQIETEGRMQRESGPSWEAFSHAVEQAESTQPIPTPLGSPASFEQVAKAQKPRPHRRWGMMASVASVATVAATVVGVMFWPVEPLPEAPRWEASSAAPGELQAPGKANSSRIGSGFPAFPGPRRSQPVGRSIPTPRPVFKEMAGPAPFFGQYLGRGGAGGHPAPVILFRSLQNRKMLGMDRPALEQPVERVSTRTVARPARRRGKVGAAPARDKRRPVAIRSKAKGSLRRLGGGAVKPRVVVNPVASIPAAPYSAKLSSRPPVSRPRAEAEVFTGIQPVAEPPLDIMLAPPGEDLKFQARMEAEEMAETDAEAKMNAADLSPADPASKKEAKPADTYQAANVAP